MYKLLFLANNYFIDIFLQRRFLIKKFLNSIIILLFLLFIYVLISAHSYVTAVSSDLSNSVFRLHVLANSDSEEDQKLKLKVRDSLLEYMNNICKNCSTKIEICPMCRTKIKEKSKIKYA